MNSQNFYFAREGQKGAIFLIVLVILSLIFDLNGLAFWLFGFLAFWLILFRNPERKAFHISSNAFLSPIDGKIIQIQSNGDYALIRIEVGLFDVGILHAPVEITSFQIANIYGSPLFFSSKKSLFSPQSEVSFGEHKMKIVQNLFHISPIDLAKNYAQGARMGFLKAGNVELRIKKIELKVNVGDKLKGGESVIGYLQ